MCACLGAIAQTPGKSSFQTLLRQGFDLHQQARFAEAIPVLEQARRLEPDDYFANLLLGIDLLRTGKATAALPYLEQAARTKPDEIISEDYLGEAEASLGRYAQAAEAYQSAVKRGYGSEQALEAWAEYALERFRQIGQNLRASEAGVDVVRRLAMTASKPTTALSCDSPIPDLERAFALRPMDFRTSTEKERAYKLSICYAVEAGRVAEQLQNSAQDIATLHRLRGDVFLRLKGDPSAAQQEYQQAIALRPGDPALEERLAEAQLAEGNMEGARQSELAVLAIDPHYREALQMLASLAMDGRDYEDALQWLRQLEAEQPASPTVQVELGKALAETGNPAEALRHLAPVLAAGYPDQKGALHAVEARVLRELGHDTEAAKAEAEARQLSDAFQKSTRASTSLGTDAVQ